jgi:hypothetical protein
MTTKVLIVNHGPDSLLVRTVHYSDPDSNKSHEVIEDMVLGQSECKVFWVHTHQQLLVGEKR